MTVFIDGGVLDTTNRTFVGYITVIPGGDDSARLFDLLAEIMQRAIEKDAVLTIDLDTEDT